MKEKTIREVARDLIEEHRKELFDPAYLREKLKAEQAHVSVLSEALRDQRETISKLVLPRLRDAVRHLSDPEWCGIVPKEDLEWLPIAQRHLEAIVERALAAAPPPPPASTAKTSMESTGVAENSPKNSSLVDSAPPTPPAKENEISLEEALAGEVIDETPVDSEDGEQPK